MDTDEFYLVRRKPDLSMLRSFFFFFRQQSELDYCLRVIWERGYDTTACRMRLFLKKPIYECEP